MPRDARMRLRPLPRLLVVLGCLLLAPTQVHAAFWDYATIVAPTQLQTLESRPVEIVVQFKPGARRDTFRAWLNGRAITARFAATPTGVRAFVDVADGLRVGLETDPPLATLNVLATLVKGPGNRQDGDLQVFFVRERSVEVPSVVGLTAEAAGAALAAAGLSLGAVSDVVRATTPTGVVIEQSPLARTLAPRGSAVSLVRVAAPPIDIAIPDSWMGLWNLEFTYRDSVTGFIDNVMPVSNSICSADPIGVAALEATAAANPAAGLTTCTASATEDRIDITCTGEFEQIFCAVPVTASISLVRSGEFISGDGEWSVGEPCGIPIDRQGQTIEIVGHRESSDPGAACGGPPSSLLQKFLRNSLMVLLGGEL